MFFFILFLILCALTFKIIKNHFNFFKIQNVPFIKPFPLFGAFKDFVYEKKSVFEVFDDIYNDKKLRDEPFYGFFMFHKPALIVKSPELIKNILVKDFNHFSDRAMKTIKNDPMHSNLGELKVFKILQS